jgi:hypothetical protein
MTDPLLPGPLWLVGCGNMAGAMLARWLEQGVDPAHVSVIRPSGATAGEGVRVTTDFPEDEVPAIVLLAMKPYQLDAVAPALAPILDPPGWSSQRCAAASRRRGRSSGRCRTCRSGSARG